MSYRISKKIFDLSVSIILLLLLLPVIALSCIIICLQAGESPIFIQERGISLTKNRFKIYKFRTMKRGIDSNISAYSLSSFLLKPHQKKYVFPFGRFLRKTGLDELPQLINVIKGEMSIVGPRPLALEDLECVKTFYPQLYAERGNINLLPGITGYWQLNKDEAGSVENLILMDKIYFQQKSLLLDIKLFLMSISISLTAKHIDSILSARENYYITLTTINNDAIELFDN